MMAIIFSLSLTKDSDGVYFAADTNTSEDAQEPDDPETEEDQGKGGEEDREFG